jgi:hypothetical protein
MFTQSRSQRRPPQTWLFLLVVAMARGGLRARELENNDDPANAASQSISQEARRILSSITTTQYKHKTEIDESKGSYLCDCSGFVGYVLNRTVAKDDAKGPLGDNDRRPVAMEYEKAFAAAPTKADGTSKWQRVVRLTDARPGDIIGWRHEKPMPGNTGHVVIVDQTPIVEEDGLARVVAIDSTTKPQINDTRAPGTSGVGRGTMWFTVDDEGRPIGYVRGSRTAKPKIESIAIGRRLPVVIKPPAAETQKNRAARPSVEASFRRGSAEAVLFKN